MKKEIIKLKCGIEITLYGAKKEVADVDIYGMYCGYGDLRFNDLKLLSELFKELDEMGYEGSGMETEIGYYDSIDGVKLNLRKKK